MKYCSSLIAAVFLSAFLASSPPAAGSGSQAFQQVVEVARSWLAAKPDQRAAFEVLLADYRGDIDAVIREVMPKGNVKFAKIVA